MPKKPKPHAERKPEDYKELLKTLWKWRKSSPGKAESATKTFSSAWPAATSWWTMTGRPCGQCHSQILGAEVAREMI